MSLQIVILAAGKGNRMNSDTPKVLHQIGGVAMLERVIHVAQQLEPKAIHVVHGNGGDQVKRAMRHLPVKWVLQEHQRGTGHAVKQALPKLAARDQVLVLYGDVPLISLRSLQHLIEQTPVRGVGLMTTTVADPTGLGRVVRNEMATIEAIVEHRDANPEQRKIMEVNTGILTTSAAHLKKWLPELKNKNKQGEYYLTDIVELAVHEGVPVGGIMIEESQEVQGVNDLWQLAQLEKYYQQHVAKKLAYSGVTLLDWPSLQVRGLDYTIGRNVTLDANVTLAGKVVIGDSVKIGANVFLKDVHIGAHAEIRCGSIVEGATVAKHAVIGPYARIRPQSFISENSKVGNFVEVKNSTIGKNSKANHLSYIGDSHIGMRVNIGAGTITCNYNGEQKFKTTIGDGAFIGSNSALVAPLNIGRRATVGAGSTITNDVEASALSLSRGQQTSVKNWKRSAKAQDADSH